MATQSPLEDETQFRAALGRLRPEITELSRWIIPKLVESGCISQADEEVLRNDREKLCDVLMETTPTTRERLFSCLKNVHFDLYCAIRRLCDPFDPVTLPKAKASQLTKAAHSDSSQLSAMAYEVEELRRERDTAMQKKVKLLNKQERLTAEVEDLRRSLAAVDIEVGSEPEEAEEDTYYMSVFDSLKLRQMEKEMKTIEKKAQEVKKRLKEAHTHLRHSVQMKAEERRYNEILLCCVVLSEERRWEMNCSFHMLWSATNGDVRKAVAAELNADPAELVILRREGFAPGRKKVVELVQRHFFADCTGRTYKHGEVEDVRGRIQSDDVKFLVPVGHRSLLRIFQE